jgi:hypothetical protein
MPKHFAPVAGFLLLAALVPTTARAAGVVIHNHTSGRVTVEIDGGYCCTAESGDDCSCAASDGTHVFKATRSDTGAVTQGQYTVTSRFEWTLADN